MSTLDLSSGSAAPIRDVRLGACAAVAERRADGCILVRNLAPLGPYPGKLTERLDHWAGAAPDRIWLAERQPDGDWRTLTYGQGRAQVRRVASALLQRDLSPERPIVILSGNGIDHALIGMAAQYAGIAYAPVSPAYSLMSSDHSKLKYIFELLTPGLVFVADGVPFATAIAHTVAEDVELVVARNAPAGRASTQFADLIAQAEDSAAVDAAHAMVGPDTIAKFLFTSGSTGMPKAVINTQRMMCANVAMIADHFAFMTEEPPVTLDWSPWNHTAGGNHNFNLFLHTGGTLYIDEGKPLPGAIGATIANLGDVAPTWYFNVPKGFDAMIPHLRADRALRQRFFSRLRMIWYAGAGMAQHIWDALDAMSVETCGERILVLTGLGSTETAPFALAANHTMVGQGNVGVPARGTQMKLVPADGKWEARLRGPNITPGYWRQDDLTQKAFDEDGYYCIGDALRFVDPDNVNRGFLFDGRIAENFKLATGTWVAAGALRAGFIDHCAPYVQDVVIAGLNRDYLAALIFPDVGACGALAGLEKPTMAEAAAAPAVRAAIAERMQALAQAATGSSTRIVRAIVLDAPPSIDKGEMTDKGSINQRAVLDHRHELVELLYRDPAPAQVIDVRRAQ